MGKSQGLLPLSRTKLVIGCIWLFGSSLLTDAVKISTNKTRLVPAATQTSCSSIKKRDQQCRPCLCLQELGTWAGWGSPLSPRTGMHLLSFIPKSLHALRTCFKLAALRNHWSELVGPARMAAQERTVCRCCLTKGPPDLTSESSQDSPWSWHTDL